MASRFTRLEAGLVQRLRTPLLVQRYLDTLPYNHEQKGATLRTFRGTLRAGTAHCLEAALSAATVMETHGWPPLLLDLRSRDDLDHVLFLFNRNGRWGTVGRSRDPGLHGRKAVFADVEALVRSYLLPFIDFTGRLIGYSVYDLAELRRCDWRLSSRNVWAVERALIAKRGRRLQTCDDEYKRWHQRYVRYRRRYPERQPLYYPNRRSWLSAGPRPGVVLVPERASVLRRPAGRGKMPP